MNPPGSEGSNGKSIELGASLLVIRGFYFKKIIKSSRKYKFFKKFVTGILYLFLSMILIISCKSIYGYDEEKRAEGGSGSGSSGGLNSEGFPSWYLTEEQQKTPYIQRPTIVFKSRGGNNTQIYHIPAVIVADNGNIIAFGDNRYKDRVDIGFGRGLIDIVYKISKDGGKTWSTEKIILPKSTSTAVADTKNKGDVSVFKCLSGKLVALAVSGGGFANGANSATPSRMLMSKSLDNGETWKLHPNMQTAKGDNLLSEPKIVGELDDGRLLMSVRNGNSSKGGVGKPRMYGVSADKGATWGTFDNPSSGKLGNWNNMLCGNVDSEGIIWTRASKHDKTRILHLLTGPNFRRGMSFWVSEDEGKTFTEKLKILDTTSNPGKYTAGYNSIDVLGDGTIVTLAEEYNTSNTVLGTADYDLVFRRYNMYAITKEVYQTNWYKNVK